MIKPGLFETMRALRGKIIYLDEHLKRLRRSARILKIKTPYSEKQLKDLIIKEVLIAKESDARVKLILSPNKPKAKISLILKKYTPYSAPGYNKGFSAQIARFKQNEKSIMARLKTTSRALYENNFRAAKKNCFDEAIILNRKGHLTEATRSNIFFIKDKEIFTPSLACGCLGGITRKVVFALAKKRRLKIHCGKFTLKDLFASDEAFLTNSLMGIMPLVKVENKIIAKPPYRVTKILIKEYQKLWNLKK